MPSFDYQEEKVETLVEKPLVEEDPDDDLLDEIRMEEGEVLYKYRQFMIAKGYSERLFNVYRCHC